MPITKLVCLGDSLTEGYQIDKTKRWSDLLVFNFPIINSGISGDTTTGMLSRFYRDVVEHAPSHLLFMGGTNDLYHGLTDQQIFSNIHAISRQAKFYDIKIIIGMPTPVIFQNIEYPNSLFLNEVQLKDRVDSYRTLLKRYAIADSKPYLDFGANMQGSHFLEDGVHPNEAGQVIMAQTVTEKLNALIERLN